MCSVAFNSVTDGLHNTYFNRILLHLLFSLRLACSLLLNINLLIICSKVNSDFIMEACKVVLEIDLFILLLVLVEETLKEKGRRKKQRSPDLDEGTHLIARSQNLFFW